MIWDIVSFGDVKTLNMVFNAIASIFADGGYTAAVIAVALFVVVGSSLVSLMSAKPELPYGRLLAGIIIYAMGFSTLTSVSIENRYDGTVTQIDNIPVAIAVPASLISSIGLYLVETSETAFGGPNDLANVSSSGYLSPLKVIASYREASMLNCPAGEATSTGANINLCQSLRAYYSECAMVKATRDNEYLRMREANRLDAIQFDSRAHTTLIVDGTNQQVTVTCSEAYDRIKTAFTGETFENIITANNVAAGVRPGEDGLIRTADALDAIQIDSSRSRDFLTSLYLNKAADSGELAFYHRMGSADLAENLNSSIQQRDYAWTLQGEMWVQIVDKFLSIMECLIYALAPFIGLMVLVGTTGSKVMMVYLQLLAVIQLIPVMLVVTQSIIINDLTNYAGMIAAQYDIGSREFAYAMTDKAKELMGLGGMISATIVPAMAMALVTGSSMAMFGAMKNAATTAKDADAMPDISSQGGAMVDMGWRNTGKLDQFGNVSSEAARTEIGSIATGHNLKSSVSAAERQASEKQEAYSQAVGQMVTNSQGQSYTTDQVQSMGQSVISSTAETQNWASSMQTQLMEQYGFNKESASSLVGSLAMAARTGAGGFGGGYDQASRFTEGLSKSELEAFSEIVSGTASSGLQASFNHAQNYMDQNSERVSTGNSYMDQSIAKAENAYQEKVSASNTYESAKSMEQTFSLSNADMMTALRQKAHEDGVDGRMNSAINELRNDDPSAYNYFREKEAEYGGERGMDSKTARLAALTATANYNGDLSSIAESVWSNPDNTPQSNVDFNVLNRGFEQPVNDIQKGISDADITHLSKDFEHNQHLVDNKEQVEKEAQEFESKANAILGKDAFSDSEARAVYNALNDRDPGGTALKVHDNLMQYLEDEGYYNPSRTSPEAAFYDFVDDVKGEAKEILNSIGFNFDTSNKEEKDNGELLPPYKFDPNEIPK
ncbi:incF plasmid conjugative transfer protein traG [Vibrio sp. JCM 19236]|nr:incF plasmid conjugative transfer protein traG [Vibrio sp. JCM 19236]